MKKLVIAVVCSAMLSGMAVLAWTALSQNARPAAAGDSFLSLPACAFVAQNEGSAIFTREWVLTSDYNTALRAPVNLPHGSIIKKVILACYDGGDKDLNLVFGRNSLGDDRVVLASFSSSGFASFFRTFSKRVTSNKYVNNLKYSYHIYLYLPATGTDKYELLHVTVVYTPPSP